jgi:iron complex outermembrane receptor protein
VSDYKRNDVKLGLEFDESPTPYLDSATTAKVEQISQEFRLNGSTQRDRWVAGLYYLDVDEHTPTSGIIVAPISLDLRDKFNQYLSSYALYGQNEFDLLDKLTLTTGLRASRERKKYHYEDNLYNRDSYNTNPASSPFIANARLFDGTSQETLWGGRIELSYRPQDHLMIYGGYNRGTKGGGFNAPLGGSALIPNSDIPYKPEELSAYEAGFKSEFFDQAARFNGTAFYYDYHNYQAYKAIGAADAVQNYQATAKGAEADLLVRPTPGLTLSASGAYIDYVVKNVSYLGITADRENVKTPPLTFATAVRYELPLGTGKVAVQGDAKYMGHQYYCVCNFESTRIPAYAVANAQVSYTTAQDRLVFSAHVDNIADKIYKVTGFDFSGTTGSSFVGYGTPRWWGITVQYNLRKSDQ